MLGDLLSSLINQQVTHENLRLAVIKPLEAAFNAQQDEPSGSDEGQASQKVFGSHIFDDIYKQRLLWYSALYKQAIEDGVNIKNQGSSFERMLFENPGNGMDGSFDYCNLPVDHEW